MLWPACTARVASSHRRSSAGAMPSAPSAAGQVASSVSVRNALTRVSIAWIFFEIAVGQDRLRHFEPVMRAGLVAQQVRPRPDHRDQRHHQFLADRIDRRVGDLREILLEIIVEQLGLVRQRGDRRIGAHRADRVVAVARHRLEEELEVLLGVAEGLLQLEVCGRVVGPRRYARPRERLPVLVGQLGQFGQFELGRFEPGLVGMLGGELLLDLVVVDDAALFEVDQQHLAGLEAPFAGDLLFRDRQHAGLRGHDHMVVVGDDVARRPEPIPVEGGADLAAVGKGDRGRAVPRLHQRGVVFVEGAALRVHQWVAGPRLGDQHHHRMGERVAAADHQQFERVVDAGGVGLPRPDQRHHLGEVGTQQFRRHRLPARRHPVDVAAHRVDLAVVAQEPVRMGEAPGREGVGRKALMDEGQSRDRQRVAQILVEAADLRRQQQTLVDDGAGREGRHVEVAQRRQPMPLRRARSRCSAPACGSSGSCARRRPGRRSPGRWRRSPGRSTASSRRPWRRARWCRSARRASRRGSAPRRG